MNQNHEQSRAEDLLYIKCELETALRKARRWGVMTTNTSFDLALHTARHMAQVLSDYRDSLGSMAKDTPCKVFEDDDFVAFVDNSWRISWGLPVIAFDPDKMKHDTMNGQSYECLGEAIDWLYARVEKAITENTREHNGNKWVNFSLPQEDTQLLFCIIHDAYMDADTKHLNEVLFGYKVQDKIFLVFDKQIGEMKGVYFQNEK